jgi:hypothetical protein
MTGASLCAVYADYETFVTGELIDALIEAVVLPKDPCARSAVMQRGALKRRTASQRRHLSEPTR